MSQAAFNIYNHAKKKKKFNIQINISRLIGIIFFLIVVSIMTSSILVVIKWINSVAGLPISKLVIKGNMYYTTKNDLCRAILLSGNLSTFISQNVNIIQQQIAQLPWINYVRVHKQYPDELKIYLVEYVPVARWNDIKMVNEKGILFSTPKRYLDNKLKPMLYGPDGSILEVLTGYYRIKKCLAQEKLHLKALFMTKRRSWRVLLDNDIRLELGRNNTIKQLQRFIELLPILNKKGKNINKRISYVDLRYESGAAVGWTSIFKPVTDTNQKQNQSQAK